MEKEYSRAVREEFDAQLRIRLPQFVYVRGQKGLGAGARVYRHESSAGAFRFVILIISSTQDEFTVEVANAPNEEVPDFEPFFDPTASGNGDTVRFRLSRFWHRQDPWWVIFPAKSTKEFIALLRDEPPVEQGLLRIPSLVQDAVDKLEQYAVPFWDEQ